MHRALVGIFVGGSSSRLGGRPKGLLESPLGGRLVERLVQVCRQSVDGEIVLVGRHAAYASLELPVLSDDPPGIGPIGGLARLLDEANGRDLPHAIALACDLPFVSAALVKKLAEHPSRAAVVAPRIDERWNPLFARYRPSCALDAARGAIAAGDRALHRVIARLGEDVDALELSEPEVQELRDWDEPGDVG